MADALSERCKSFLEICGAPKNSNNAYCTTLISWVSCCMGHVTCDHRDISL